MPSSLAPNPTFHHIIILKDRNGEDFTPECLFPVRDAAGQLFEREDFEPVRVLCVTLDGSKPVEDVTADTAQDMVNRVGFDGLSAAHAQFCWACGASEEDAGPNPVIDWTADYHAAVL